MFAVVSLALLMASVDSTIVATALPAIGKALHARVNWTSWTITAYQLGLVVAMPLAGRLSDSLGRKRVMLLAAVVFTLASLCCGLTSDIVLLVVLRVIQALGGGAFVPSATGIVADVYGSRRDAAVGLFSSIFPLGAIIGPILGGVIVTGWSWRGIFLVNVPVGAVFLALGSKVLPDSPPGGGRIAPLGATLLGGTVLAMMLGIASLGEPGAGLGSPSTYLALVAAGLLGALFLWHTATSAVPVIPPKLIFQGSFAAMNLLNFAWGAGAIGLVSLIPLYAEDRFSLSPLAAGGLLTTLAVGEIVVAAAASLAIHRTGYHAPMVAGVLLIAAGLVVVAVRPRAIGAFGWLALASAVIGLGVGASAPAANNATLELSPGDVGAITGLRGASRQSGAIFAVAITTALVARSAEHLVTFARAYLAAGLLSALAVPLVRFVPRHRSPPRAAGAPAGAGAVPPESSSELRGPVGARGAGGRGATARNDGLAPDGGGTHGHTTPSFRGGRPDAAPG